MTVAVRQATSFSQGSTEQTVSAPAVTVVDGDRVVLFITWDVGVTTTPPTISGFSLLGSALETGNQKVSAFENRSPTPGSNVYTADWGSGVEPDSRGIEALSISGSDLSVAASIATNWQPTPVLTTTDYITSTNLTPPSATGLLLGISQCTHTVSGGTPSAGTGFTSIETMWNFGGFDQARSEFKLYTSNAAQAATFTATGTRDHLTIALAIPSTSIVEGDNAMFLGNPTLLY